MSLDTHEENDLIDFLEDNGLLGVIDAEGVQFRDGGESVVGLGNNIATDADNNLTAQTGSTLEVQDDGSAVDSGVNVLNLVSNIQATQASQGEVDLTIPQDAIGGSEIDQSSSLTWTSDQQFNSTIIAGGDVVPDTDGTGNLGTDAKTWGAVQTVGIDITNYHMGFDGYMWSDGSANTWAIDPNASVVAGGSNDLNVSDGSDFAEVLEYVTNTLGWQTIRVHGNDLRIKTSQTINGPLRLIGSGRNSTIIEDGADLSGLTALTVDSGPIHRLEKVKFSGGTGTPPDTWIKFDGNAGSASEVNIAYSEFRDASSVGLELDSTGLWNSIIDTWFLNSSKLVADGLGELRCIGNRAQNVGVELKNISELHLDGNDFDTIDLASSTLGPSDDTFVVARLANNTSNSLSSGSWHNILDTTDEDRLGEMSGSQVFTPEATGWYRIDATAAFFQAASGDEVRLAVLRDSDDASFTGGVTRKFINSATDGIQASFVMKLSAGTGYAVKFINFSTDCGVDGGSKQTWARIQPANQA